MPMAGIASTESNHAKITTTCAIVAAVCAAVGLPSTVYCGYAAWDANQHGERWSTMSLPSHYDIAFDLMIGSSFLLLMTAIVWLWRKRKIRRIEIFTPTFKAEIYRAVCGSKLPFSEDTHILFKAMGRNEEFEIDVDILAEIYIVNASSQTQYIRELIGFVEIEGKKFPLQTQSRFYAYELNGQHYEWCLDPTPRSVNSASDRRSNLESLPPIITTFPVTLEPKKPLYGWVKLLASKINPDKLKDPSTYKFVIRDSLGAEYPITPTRRENRGEIGIKAISQNR